MVTRGGKKGLKQGDGSSHKQSCSSTSLDFEGARLLEVGFRWMRICAKEQNQTYPRLF